MLLVLLTKRPFYIIPIEFVKNGGPFLISQIPGWLQTSGNSPASVPPTPENSLIAEARGAGEEGRPEAERAWFLDLGERRTQPRT